MRMILIFAVLLMASGGWFANGMSKKADSAKASTPNAASAPVQPQASNYARSYSIPRDSRGHFQTEGRVDGRRVSFMVDTGASVIALTERDAAKLGVRPSSSEFRAQVKTANGIVLAAPVQLNSVEVGGITVRDVRALVVPDKSLSENLLGLSYLTKLKRFEYSNGKLVLEN